MNVEEIAESIRGQGVSPQVAAGVSVRTADWRWVCETGGDTHVVFDLASVTKPMTAVAIQRLGDLRAEPLGAVLAEARGTPSEHVPVELFLAHRAGLEGHAPLYAPLLRGESVDRGVALRTAAGARRKDAPGEPPIVGFSPLYSDLGYVLAGEALAQVARTRDAGEAIAKLVLEPLGAVEGSTLDEVGTVRELEARGKTHVFAPTETVPWRGGQVVAAVHDENAWALTGKGGSGHAGIFGTVGAVLAFGRAVLDEVERGGLGWLVAERPGGTLRAGFDGKSLQGSSAGARMGARAFGHLGFTGTSLWIDPDAHVVVALLTNRVCPTRDHMAIRAARPWAHDALFDRGTELVRR